MYENGVTTEMLFDYGTYSMKGTLSHYEALPPTSCDAGGGATKAVAQ